MKSFFKTIFILGIIIFLIVFILGFPFTCIMIYPLLFAPDPAEPVIKYGEFPFRLEYEINGKKEVVQNTLVCELDGFRRLGTGYKARRWKSYLKNNSIEWLRGKNNDEELEIVLLKIDEKTRISFLVGSSYYYMNDPEYGSSLISYNLEDDTQEFYMFPGANYSIDEINEEGNEILYRPRISAKELWEKYKIKLLNWEHSKPIKNEFIK